ncbi:EcsC family protein [Staphylococcus pasteuri]|uniref:EcsC family protein n=1 Tax=Staphylococcus pasteuri TaxID=45972 RepID=UPI001E432A47|nr:EcsC family protein [Staphylococcus pasteuri]MCD9067464.1 EcsC family protein [Staphylococcus pasteuri]WAE41807.1 EcsC family protein [Staphylococcus pasteuri]
MTEVNQESKALQVIEQAMKIPYVKVNRKEFLLKTFSNYNIDMNQLIENGPVKLVSKKDLDKVANKAINNTLTKSTSASFMAGLPGGIALAATIPADMAQFYGFALKLAQELSYIYGLDDLFDSNDELAEDSKNMLIIYLGVMLGVTAAGSTVRVLSKQASTQALKKIPSKALTKTIYYPILKKVLKTFGIKLTKDTFAKGVSKAIPVVGGVISGGMNYASLRPMGKKLKNELSLAIDYSSKDIEKDIKIIEGEGVKLES